MLILKTVKWALCSLSALFTALFVVSISGTGFTPAALPLIAVGLSLDTLKFSLWPVRGWKPLAFALLVFSFLASVAFFTIESNRKIEQARTQTAAYVALQARIETAKSSLAVIEQAAAQNAASVHWKRLDMSAEQRGEIETAGELVANLTEQLHSAGREQALDSLPLAAFFNAISDMTGASFGVVQFLFFSALALFIELGAMAAIIITTPVVVPVSEEKPPRSRRSQRIAQGGKQLKRKQVAPKPAANEANGAALLAGTQNAANLSFDDEQMARMRDDILAGRVVPKHRELRAAGYTNNDKRKAVLDTLKSAGIVEDGQLRKSA